LADVGREKMAGLRKYIHDRKKRDKAFAGNYEEGYERIKAAAMQRETGDMFVTKFIEQNTLLIREFDKYILEHPEFAEKIPDNALVVMQIEGDEEFNRWARQTSHSAAEMETPVVYVIVAELKPVRSRIEKLKLELVA